MNTRLYGYAKPDAELALVTFRLTARLPVPRPDLTPVADAARSAAPAPVATRQVFFEQEEAFLDTPVYQRSDLRGGDRLDGPAIIEQMDATTVIPPAAVVEADARAVRTLRRQPHGRRGGGNARFDRAAYAVGNFAATGRDGGLAGMTGSYLLNPDAGGDGTPVRGTTSGVMLGRGDLLRVSTPGGGGFGDPRTRDPQRVLADVAAGKVSSAAARRDYAVALSPDGLAVDADATARLRGEA